MTLLSRLVSWWRVDPIVPTWRSLSRLSQIPNDQIRAGSGVSHGVSHPHRTATHGWVRVRIKHCYWEGQ